MTTENLPLSPPFRRKSMVHILHRKSHRGHSYFTKDRMPEATKNVLPGIFAHYKKKPHSLFTHKPSLPNNMSALSGSLHILNHQLHLSSNIWRKECKKKRKKEKPSERNPQECRKFLLIPQENQFFFKFKSFHCTVQNCTRQCHNLAICFQQISTFLCLLFFLTSGCEGEWKMSSNGQQRHSDVFLNIDFSCFNVCRGVRMSNPPSSANIVPF